MSLDPVVVVALSLLLSYIMVDAGLHKLRSPRHYARIIDDYDVLPGASGRIAVWMIGLLELACGIAMLAPATHTAGVLTTGLLLAVYFLAMALNLLRGRVDIDCGCHGPAHRQALSPWLLARNLVLVLVAVQLLVFEPSGREMLWIDWFVGIGAALGAIMLYATCGLLMSNNALLAKLK